MSNPFWVPATRKRRMSGGRFSHAVGRAADLHPRAYARTGPCRSPMMGEACQPLPGSRGAAPFGGGWGTARVPHFQGAASVNNFSMITPAMRDNPYPYYAMARNMAPVIYN